MRSPTHAVCNTAAGGGGARLALQLAARCARAVAGAIAALLRVMQPLREGSQAKCIRWRRRQGYPRLGADEQQQRGPERRADLAQTATHPSELRHFLLLLGSLGYCVVLLGCDAQGRRRIMGDPEINNK